VERRRGGRNKLNPVRLQRGGREGTKYFTQKEERKKGRKGGGRAFSSEKAWILEKGTQGRLKGKGRKRKQRNRSIEEEGFQGVAQVREKGGRNLQTKRKGRRKGGDSRNWGDFTSGEGKKHGIKKNHKKTERAENAWNGAKNWGENPVKVMPRGSGENLLERSS